MPVPSHPHELKSALESKSDTGLESTRSRMSTTELILAVNALFIEKPIHQHLVLARFSTVDALINGIGAYLDQTRLGEGYRELVMTRKAALNIPEMQAEIEKRGITVIPITDPLYPPQLKELHDPPVCLFAKGRLEVLQALTSIRPGLAVVGPRKSTEYGREVTRFLVKSVSDYLTIISGLAAGIDAAAHQSALAAGAPTIGVIGCGLDGVYPKENARLYMAVETHGVIITEFPLGTPPHPLHFPQRNRIVSGLSQGVLVVEAEVKSGSLITARLAVEQNRDVYAVPGSIFSSSSEGVHSLIQDGAKCVTKPSDILEDFGIRLEPEKGRIQLQLTPTAISGHSVEHHGDDAINQDDSIDDPIDHDGELPSAHNTPSPPKLSEDEAAILAAVSVTQPCQIDDIIETTQLPVLTVMQTLTLLEVNGWIVSVAPQSYQRRTR